ncbi:TPA: AraC family transcriptional regulator [Serratia marcescens]|uniref:AraC family transcriptional regulator n=1 Tax=Serratia TaxID=613 RepID=UPI003833999D
MNDNPHFADADCSEWRAGPWLIALGGRDAAGREYRLGTREYGWHQHVRGQLLCVESGLLHVRTAHGDWVLPPQRAGWIPPATQHRVQVCGALSGWSLLLAPETCNDLSNAPCVIGISPVLQALALRAEGWDKRSALTLEQDRMAQVMRDEIRLAPTEPLHLPMSSHPRLAGVLQALLAQPGSERSLEAWAEWGAMSPRTLRRLMVGETGLSFAQWRQQARLSYALAKLAEGETVLQIAETLGYASPSNFIAMFRKAFGDSPARYFSASAGKGR